MQIRKHSFPAIICYTLALVVANPAQEHHSEHTWDYGESLGPSHWGDLKPEFAPCRNGHRQSPIDIRNPQKADLPPIQFDYRESPLHIIDNGHTVMINYQPGSSISVGGKKYAPYNSTFIGPVRRRSKARAMKGGAPGTRRPGR